MTNIGAIKIMEGRGTPTSKEYVVCIADGMGSMAATHSKIDDAQKLSKIGDYFLMGTGSGDLINHTADLLSNSHFSSAKELSQAVLDVTHGFKLKATDGLNFIVAGKDADELAIYRINTTGNFIPYGGKAKYSQRGATKVDSIFDGSGSRYVTRYAEGLEMAGKPLIFNTLVGALCVMYDFGKNGARDAGVNDRLQFGVLSVEHGMSRLYHPEITMASEAQLIYFNDMLGQNLKLTDAAPGSDEAKAIFIQGSAMNSTLQNFYTAFTTDLMKNAKARQNYTMASERLPYGLSASEDVAFMANRIQETRHNVANGVDALVNKGLDNIAAYLGDFYDRQMELTKQVAALPPIVSSQ